jgi:uncharacterized membrane-anchored protein YhcB (DUF1043 family)
MQNFVKRDCAQIRGKTQNYTTQNYVDRAPVAKQDLGGLTHENKISQNELTEKNIELINELKEDYRDLVKKITRQRKTLEKTEEKARVVHEKYLLEMGKNKKDKKKQNLIHEFWVQATGILTPTVNTTRRPAEKERLEKARRKAAKPLLTMEQRQDQKDVQRQLNRLRLIRQRDKWVKAPTSVNPETGTKGSQAIIAQAGMIVAGEPIVMETVGVKQIFPMKN